tara:strand:- start:32 stop:643 length:612 start_codon:yes stop_codon:yes gene_type:complete
MNFETIPLFSHPINIFNLNFNTQQSEKIQEIINSTEYRLNDSGNAFISKNLKVLEYPKLNFLKDEFSKALNEFNEKIMGYEKNNLKITTSWFTKCEPGQQSHRHNHKNSLYSGVYYNNVDDYSKILFYNNDWRGNNYQLKINDYNFYNSDTWSIEPKSGSLIIFPSYLSHKIIKNNSTKTRYSLAFNCIPRPPYGDADSSVRS